MLADYAGGKLSRDEMYLVEKHLAGCDLCSDALEGLSNVKNRSRLQKIFTSINNLIDKRTQAKSGMLLYVDFRVKMAVAAIFISVFGITILFKYLLNDQKKDMMALRTEKEGPAAIEKSKDKEKVADSIASPEQDAKTISSGEKIQPLVAVNDQENEKLETTNKDQPTATMISESSADGQGSAEQKAATTYFWSPQKDETAGKVANENYRSIEKVNEAVKAPVFAGNKSAPDRSLVTDSVSIDNGLSQTKNINLLDKVFKEEAEKTVAESQSKTKFSKKAETKVDGDTDVPTAGVNNYPITTNSTVTTAPVAATGTSTLSDQRYETALKKYDSLDYSGSKALLESYLTSYPEDYNALYYCATSNYFLKNYDKAITYFTKVVKKKDFIFFDTSQWYLALSYIGNKDNTKAEKILNEIVAAGGSFKTQAAAKLLEIKK
jgi:TolA-binding protein